jgi:hypothetical protein
MEHYHGLQDFWMFGNVHNQENFVNPMLLCLRKLIIIAKKDHMWKALYYQHTIIVKYIHDQIQLWI